MYILFFHIFFLFRLRGTFKSLFWAIFGMGEPDFAQIVVGIKVNETYTKTGDHIFTEGVGYTLWGLYQMVTAVILLNMVIAMMTESYQRVQVIAFLRFHFNTFLVKTCNQKFYAYSMLDIIVS